MLKYMFDMQINIKVSYKLMLSFWVCATSYAQSTQNEKFAYIFAVSPEKHEGEVDFFPSDEHKVFYKLIVSLWVCVARHAQSTQNNQFTISL